MMHIIFYPARVMSELSGRKAVSHGRIVEVAARAVRRGGYQGVNVTEVMREAGLTHGGFYAHFASRDALLAEAVEKAGADLNEVLRGQIARRKAGVSALRALIDTYLAADHARDCDNGCPLSLLASDVFRQAPEVAEPSRGLAGNLRRLVKEVLPEQAEPGAAWAIVSSLLGAVQIARALGDTRAARAVLADTKSNLLARYDT
jgi:AcrR family transcriptional regulator